MKKIFVIILALLLLTGCTTPYVDTTETIESVETSSKEIISAEEFDAIYGIAVNYSFDLEANTFTIDLAWTNKNSFATTLKDSYLINVRQNDTELICVKDDFEVLFMEVNPNATLVTTFVYDLIDAEAPVTLVISNTETEFWFDDFYPEAVG